MEYRTNPPKLEQPEKMQPLFEFVPVEYNERAQIICMVGKPRNVQAHFHLDGEIILALDGRTRLGCEGKEYILTRGDLFLVNPLDIHFIDESSVSSLFLTVYFDMGATTLTFGAEADPYGWRFFPNLEKDEARLSALRRELLCMADTFFGSADLGRRLEIPGRLLCFVSYLFRWGLYKKNESGGGFAHVEIDQARQLMAYVNANAGEQISLASVASTLNLSGRAASELLKKITGRSFSEYLSGVRLEKAKKKLIFENDKPVLDIAMESGFDSLPSFYRIFRKYTGLSPNEFRGKMGQFMTELSEGGYEALSAAEAISVLEKFEQREKER